MIVDGVDVQPGTNLYDSNKNRAVFFYYYRPENRLYISWESYNKLVDGEEPSELLKLMVKAFKEGSV